MKFIRDKKGNFIKGSDGFWTGKKLSLEHRKKLSESHQGERPWRKGQKLLNNTNEKHFNWRGDKVGYVALHSWITRKRGKPNYCEHCKRTDKKKYEWANIDHQYNRIIEDYLRLCTSCHRKYDYLNNNYAPKGRKTKI